MGIQWILNTWQKTQRPVCLGQKWSQMMIHGNKTWGQGDMSEIGFIQTFLKSFLEFFLETDTFSYYDHSVLWKEVLKKEENYINLF